MRGGAIRRESLDREVHPVTKARCEYVTRKSECFQWTCIGCTLDESIGGYHVYKLLDHKMQRTDHRALYNLLLLS